VDRPESLVTGLAAAIERLASELARLRGELGDEDLRELSVCLCGESRERLAADRAWLDAQREAIARAAADLKARSAAL